MAEQIIFGNPMNTEALVREIPCGESVRYFAVEESADAIVFTYPLAKEDIVYGLGETVRGINKRGGRYVSFNTDDPHHHDEMPSLYGSHNFLIVAGRETFGAFFDTPARVIFEVDYKGSGSIVVTCPKDVRLVLCEGGSADMVCRNFLNAIGKPHLPPLWAFGFGQSRWGYKKQRHFNRVVKGYEKAGIPLDYICMDIDYMDRYIDFTVNQKRFPDLKGYVAKLKEKGIRLVPIIDAGVKVEPGNPTYDEGVEKGYFCTNHEGKYFQAAVWPGFTHFPDFFQPEAREWFGKEYKKLTDLGIEGFWNDMNEPAIFYSEYTKRAGFLETAKNFFFPAKKEKETNAYIDYRNFYHNIDGKRVLHEDVHNLYGALMTRAASEQLDKLIPTRFLLFSRSSYIGAHRYGGIWTGDNASGWDHLRRNVMQMPSLNMCGFLFSGADTGGFGGNCSRELMLRWLAFSAFTPLMRNHSMIMSKKQECYRYRGKKDFRSIVSLRYKLLPYIYSEFMKAALRGDMYFKPLAFVYSDERSKLVEDQLLVGDSIMIAPIIEKGVKGRTVYLPEDMTEVLYDGDAFHCTPVKAGERSIEVKLNEVVFFIRKGKCLPVGKGARNTTELDLRGIQLLGDGDTYEQYIDDGFTKDVKEKNIVLIRRSV